LKVYDKWEGKGYGMATLTNSCLDNEIDLPYYKFHSQDELSLFIPKGKVLDQEIENLLDLYGAYIYIKLNGNEMTQEQKVVFSYFYKSELANRQDYYTILLTKDNNHFNAIESLRQAGLLLRHELSDDINTIYYVDQAFFRNDFNTELRGIFGGAFDDLGQDYKRILNIIYQYNTYSKTKYPSANQIGDIIWVQDGNGQIIKGLESFKRQNRSRVQKLFKKGFLVRILDNPQYKINSDFERVPSIFDESELNF
jgi:ATP-dependent DNA helicase RecG